MLNTFKTDISRYMSRPNDPANIYLFFEQGLWAIAVYRFGRFAHRSRVPVFRLILKILAFVMFKSIEISTGISLPASAQIGKGFYVGHFGGIIVHSDAIIGDNCSIGPGVVIGSRGQGATGVPKIGNGVYVGVGAKVLGGIKVGDNVRIGANAVVISDVPDNSTVVGVPGRIIGRN